MHRAAPCHRGPTVGELHMASCDLEDLDKVPRAAMQSQ
jgi:hypothetical protein